MTPLETIQRRLEDYGYRPNAGGTGAAYHRAISDVLDLIIQHPTCITVAQEGLAWDIAAGLRGAILEAPLPEGQIQFIPVPTDLFKTQIIKDLNLILNPPKED